MFNNNKKTNGKSRNASFANIKHAMHTLETVLHVPSTVHDPVPSFVNLHCSTNILPGLFHQEKKSPHEQFLLVLLLPFGKASDDQKSPI